MGPASAAGKHPHNVNTDDPDNLTRQRTTYDGTVLTITPFYNDGLKTLYLQRPRRGAQNYMHIEKGISVSQRNGTVNFYSR